MATINGSGGDDTLAGTGEDDIILGDEGSDTIDGGAGNDTIAGGHGVDVLAGGAGRDVFRFGTPLPNGPVVNDSGGWGGTWGDTITDFRPGVDTIDVSAMFTFATREGIRDTAAFAFVGQDAFSGEEPEIRYEWRDDGTTLIQMDGDLDPGNNTDVGGRPDGANLLLGHHELDVQDFIL
jgi:serralysin